MTLIKKSNQQHLPTVFDWMDQFFGNRPAFKEGWVAKVPNVNIAETETGFRLDVAAPGLQKSDFDINLDKNIITIRAQKENQTEEANERFTRKEFNYQTFERSFVLPDTIEQSNIEANYADGVLSISLPKKEEAKLETNRKVAIQ
ncbi:MAG: Hsp20/alpha crystallin family protein [Chitinophagales bacterium]|nr:Hsp20/alpha crystallin family protein [Bacteroidota bacterium]MCB9042807.1 Hsp20/alpha crystallin family protein [Chitinophagales bacterium]